jgi:inner membrane protein YidH
MTSVMPIAQTVLALFEFQERGRRSVMLSNYGDHSANERTFLAGLRTSFAVIAFGVAIEKFEQAITDRAAPQSQWLGSHRGFLVSVAVCLLFTVLAFVRYFRTAWRLDHPEMHSADAVRADVTIFALLEILVVAVAVWIVVT